MARAMNGKDVDVILDDGCSGLQFFIQLHESYVSLYGDPQNLTLKQLLDRYDEQRGMDLSKLSDTAAAMQTTLTEIDSELSRQKGLLTNLSSIWSGTAGDRANDMLTKQTQYAGEDREKFDAAKKAIDVAVPALQSAVQAKANLVNGFASESGEVKVDGKSVETIKMLVEAAKTGFTSSWGFEDAFLGVVTFGAATVIEGVRGLTNEGKQYYAQKWLDEHFKTTYNNRVTEFINQCNATHTAVSQAYSTLGASMDAIGKTREYPRPAVSNTPSPAGPAPSPGPSPGPSNTPSQTTPAPSYTPSPTGTTQTPASTTAASVNTALSGLASTLATALTTAVSTFATVATAGMSALGTVISEAIEDLTDDDKDDDGKEDKEKDGNEEKKSTKSAEFDLAGKHYKLEVGADGQPKLVETSSDGKTQEYSVKLDANGNPIIDTGEKKEEKKEDTTQSPAAGTPTSGIPTTSTPKKGGQDGEHTPKVVPVTGEEKKPEPAAPTGAELSEAGPL
ncbi:WXG100 family type VII secretion target [Nocardia sp. NPDC048505]|uniref:WXG100 family type VII secretion target n=1 Tax=unclassified Nocardia TaxID=2637762 RepID=UPI0033E3D55F